MKPSPLFLTVSLLALSVGAGRAVAQPRLDAAVNAASYAAAELPHGELAPGSLVVLFGEGLGPEETAHNEGFPLPATLAGTSVEVSVEGFTGQASMIYAGGAQAAVVLPSQTPAGSATVIVTVDGEASEPLPVEIASRRFGIFSVDSSGQGVGVFTYATSSQPLVNSLIASANPGEVWTLWGTGLGAAAGDDASGPLPGALPNAEQLPDVEVLVGGEPVETIYQGRSGCCAGLDQISFVVPVGAAGCAVPVQILADGALSNTVTMSIALGGRTCIDPEGIFSTDLLERVDHSSLFRLGSIWLSRNVANFGGGMRIESDNLNIQFSAQPLHSLFGSAFYRPTFYGACYVRQFRLTRDFFDRIRDETIRLNAGQAISVVGPAGAVEAPIGTALQYGLNSRNGEIELPEGEYSFQGFGGPDVGAFSANGRVYPHVQWTNRETIGKNVDRGTPLEVTWDADGADGLVSIGGRSHSIRTIDLRVGAEFRCIAPASAGSFSIPREVLSALPETVEVFDEFRGSLWVNIDRLAGTFAPESGVDLGFVQYSQGEEQQDISYR